MDNTAIHAGSPPATGTNGTSTAIQARTPLSAPPRPPRTPKSVFWQALEYAADLRITVTLFTMSLFLVFWGTLAQTDKGIWTVVGEYFRSPMVWVPLNIVFIKPILQFDFDMPGSIPYPGGWLLGGLLLANLLAAHTVSFKVSWKRSGILVIHAGIIVMMLGELITGLFALEGHMHIAQGGTSNHVEHSHAPELAIVDSSNLKKDHVTVIPTARLRRGGLITDTELPFDVEIVQYMVNSRLVDPEPRKANRATHGQGLSNVAEERPEGAGVDTESKVDIASVYITLKRKGNGEPLGTYMFSAFLPHPDSVEVDGKTYQVNLRFKRTYKNYTFRLDKLNVEFWPNTTKPKDYSSFVHLTDPTQNEDRDVRIFMNNPLTYGGETFYQSGVNQEPGGPPATTLQVVRNPGWMMPYLSCFMVAGGMLIHFGQNLYRFVDRFIERRAF